MRRSSPSERAIQVNIAIIRVFTKLRSFLAIENSNSQKIDKLERETNTLFKVVFEKMDQFETNLAPRRRKKIGLKP